MKKVIIAIRGNQYLDDDGSNIEFVTEGEYEKSGDRITFSYYESELTGMEGTLTTVVVKPGIVRIRREGTVSMSMEFVEGEKHHFVYETQYGSFTAGLETSGIISTLGESGGDIEINYVLTMENSGISRNTFKINIRQA